MRRAKPLLVALAAAALATGGAGTWLAGAATGYDLPVGPPAAAPGELVFATGEELHVGARTYAVRPAPETMVATAGGLYYLADGVLYRWRDGAAGSARVAALGGIGWLLTTADGRYLAYVDHEHGPRNLGGHRIAETVVFDTTTGREVVRDSAGNGARTGTEDLSDLYGESTPTVLGFDDDAVYVQTARGGAVLRWDLDTGRRSALGPRERPVTENRPDGSRLAYTLGRGPLVSSSGDRRPVRLDVGGRQFVLAGWLDDDRFYGLALDRAPRPTAEVTVCSVPSGRCVAAGPRVPAEDARCRCSPPATSRTDPRLVPAGMLGR